MSLRGEIKKRGILGRRISQLKALRGQELNRA